MAQPRTSKSTIKNDPFESVIPTDPPPIERRPAPPPPRAKPVADDDAAGSSPPPAAPKAAAADAAVPPEGRQKLTVHLEADIVNRVKNAAYWNPRLTIARIAERGIRLALREVEKEHGGAYPQREGELVGGRPIK